jgi:hypothetical protein
VSVYAFKRKVRALSLVDLMLVNRVPPEYMDQEYERDAEVAQLEADPEAYNNKASSGVIVTEDVPEMPTTGMLLLLDI